MKRLCSVLAVCVAMAGMLFGIMQTEAADIGKIRGRVNVDLETFVCVEKTNKDSGMKSKNSKNSEYELWFSNSFTDRNNIGVTYRSGSSYNMTDVDKIETYMCSQQNSADKFLFYIDSNPNKYYHRMDRDKITNGTFGGNGKYWYFSNLAVQISNHVYSKDYHDRNITINPQYGSSYVFLGIAHEWQWHNAKLTFDNETQSGKFNGGLTLILKKHNITLLQPEYPSQVLENGSQKEYVAFSNLKMRLEDGKSYDPGKTGDIYRDERVTVQYTLADAGNCSLKGYRFYSDKDRKNLLYTKVIEGGETESSFTLDAALIQNLEKGKSVKSLGDIYVEPIFEQRKVEVEISRIVPENSQSGNANHVQVSAVTGDESQRYDSFRLEDIDKNGKTEVIGSFQKNKAAHIGDVITFDYTPNPNYKGEFQFSHYEYRMCESQNQVSGTYPVEALYSQDKYDISQKLSTTYFWMQIHVMLKAEITLTEKTVTYNNRSVTIDPAEVTYPEGYPAPTGTITYTYYKITGEYFGQEEKLDAPPIDAGKYFVIATMKQDAYYVSAESGRTFLTIEKAVPVLSNMSGSQITYGDPLSDSRLSGTAEGVSRSKINGTFNWKDGTQRLNAGTNKADVIFTPDARYANNYDIAEGKAIVRVAQATPTIDKGENKTVVYNGEPVLMEGACATGIDGEATEQKITYDYYTSKNCDTASKLPGPPTDRGTYYVLAAAAAQGNYGYAKASADIASVITIQPRPARLLQVPVDALAGPPGAGEYRVYVSNVVDGKQPEGTIQLSWIDGTPRQCDMGAIKREESTGRYYASAVRGTGDIPAAGIIEVTASYQAVANDNYVIGDDRLEVNTGGDSGAISEDVSLQYGTGDSVTRNVIDDLNVALAKVSKGSVSDDKVKVILFEPDSSNDVVGIDFNGKEITFKNPQNAGDVSVTAYVTVTSGTTRNVPGGNTLDGQNVPDEPGSSDASDLSGASDEPNSLDISNAPDTRQAPDGSDMSAVPEAQNTPDIRSASEPQNSLGAHYYVTYHCTVKKAEQEIEIEKPILTYNALPQTYRVIRNTIGGERAGDVTDISEIRYTGTSYLGETYDDLLPPTNAGIYRMQIKIPATRNLEEYNGTCEGMMIEQAEPTITIADKAVTYDGHPQTLDSAVLESGIQNGTDVTGAVSYQYTCIDGTDKDQVSWDAPIHAGKYTVDATVAADGNYKEARSAKPAQLNIGQAKCTVEMQGKSAVYTGEPIYLNSPAVIGVEDENVSADTRVAYKPSSILGRSGGTGQSQAGSSDGILSEFIKDPTDAGIYYGWAVKGKEGDYKAALSDRAILVIRKAEVNITVPEQAAVYSGETPKIEGTSVTAETGKDLLVESALYLRYHYFSDPEATEEIDPPVDAGVYYVQAQIGEQKNYKAAKSNVQKLTIEKAVPTLSDVSVSDIIYGETGNETQAQGKATGVKSEELNGAFQPEGEICTEKPDAGTYEMSVRFTPDADTARNYQPVSAVVLLNVRPAGIEIVGGDKTGVYDGQPVILDEVRLKGVPEMPAPSGEIRYEYFTDEACTQPAGYGGAGVTDAGTYYCKVTVVPDTGNYRETSETYLVTVEKSPAAISLRVSVIDKNQADNIVTIHGKLPGVFDAPTGSIRILIRGNEGDGQSTDGGYRMAVENIGITETNGVYGFTAVVPVGADGIYDFKAEYVEGEKKNYVVYPGELTEIDMSKLPQHIDFEAHLLRIPYGSEAFALQVNETEAPGSGEITYRLMEKISTPGAVSVSSEGMVEIKNVGTAFVTAVKQGDGLYNGALSVLCIRVAKAPVMLAMEDRTVVYDGNPQGIWAAVTSLDRPIEENLPIVYVYVDQASGQVLEEEPVGVGTYNVFAYLPETEYYLRAVGRSVLTITQAEASISLSVYKKDVYKQSVTLVGRLPDIFDWPNGTVTIYMRRHGSEEWTEAAEEIQIVESDGRWGFFDVISVPAEGIYDFKAVFVEAAGQNYRILDGTVENVDMRRPRRPGNPSGDDPGADDPSGDDPGTDNPPSPGANDPNQPSGNGPGTDGTYDPNKPYFDNLNVDLSNGAGGSGQNKAAHTGDPSSCRPAILLVMSIAVLAVMLRKRTRDLLRN